jgi:hypothetical protein
MHWWENVRLSIGSPAKPSTTAGGLFFPARGPVDWHARQGLPRGRNEKARSDLQQGLVRARPLLLVAGNFYWLLAFVR